MAGSETFCTCLHVSAWIPRAKTTPDAKTIRHVQHTVGTEPRVISSVAEFRNEAEASRLLAGSQLSDPYYTATINIAIVDTRSCLENLTPRVPGTEAVE